MKRKQLSYCPFCNAYQEYAVETVETKTDVRGVSLLTLEHHAYCQSCKKEILVRELFDEDQKVAFEKYKEEINLLTAAQIRAFRKQNHLSATELSQMLGLGEKTITRLEGGDIQSRSVDNLIRLFANNYGSLRSGLSEGRSLASLLPFPN